MLCILIMPFAITAQQICLDVLSQGGNSGQVGNWDISWTAGEMVIATLSSGNYSLTQGFHQDYYCGKIVAHDQPFHDQRGLCISIRGNPIKNVIHLQTECAFLDWAKYQFTDSNGRKLLEGKAEFNNRRAQIDPGDIPNGVYFLTLTNEFEGFTQYFKILKNL